MAKTRSRVLLKDVDRGSGKILDELMKLALKPYVKVGYLETAGKHKNGSGPSVAEVATFHEFGTKDESGKTLVPERSHIRSTMDEKKKKFDGQIDKLIGQIVDGKTTVENALGVLGLSIKSEVQKKIRKGIEPALAESTIIAKGSSKPLIDTGQMINSINHEVKLKG